MNPNSELFGIAILSATFVGPIAAVVVTRFMDWRREKAQRRLTIFRTLMATRAAGLNPDRVAALNMIQIDFADSPEVLQAWHSLLAHFGTELPREEERHEAFFRDRQRLSTVLLSKMAEVLWIKIDQLDILDRVYYPNGLVNMEAEQEVIRRWFVDLAVGRRALPVMAYPSGEPERDKAQPS